jgi:hypothetical protein
MYYSRRDVWVIGTTYGTMNPYAPKKDIRNFKWRVWTYKKKHSDTILKWYPYESFYTYITAMRMRNYLLKQGICAIIRNLRPS